LVIGVGWEGSLGESYVAGSFPWRNFSWGNRIVHEGDAGLPSKILKTITDLNDKTI